jgi:hypothetical protein
MSESTDVVRPRRLLLFLDRKDGNLAWTSRLALSDAPLDYADRRETFPFIKPEDPRWRSGDLDQMIFRWPSDGGFMPGLDPLPGTDPLAEEIEALARPGIEVPKPKVPEPEYGMRGYNRVIDEVLRERVHQDKTWGGPEHDDNHSIDDWRLFLHGRVEALGKRSRPQDRDLLVEIAALAVAAVESWDRKSGRPPALKPPEERWVSAEAGSVVRDWPGRVLDESPLSGFTLEQWASIRDAVREEVARVTGGSDIGRRDVVDAAEFKALQEETTRCSHLATNLLDLLQPKEPRRPGDLETSLEVILGEVREFVGRMKRVRAAVLSTEELDAGG